MLVGSFSSNLYGRPRSTADADFVIQASAESIELLRRKLGADFLFDPQLSFETVTSTTRIIIHHRQSAFTVELFLLSPDPHDQSRFQRRRRMPIDEHPVFVPTAEDVIITKLRWSKSGQRSKDINDARDVIAVQRGQLDLRYIRDWCDQHGTREIFERLLADTSAS